MEKSGISIFMILDMMHPLIENCRTQRAWVPFLQCEETQYTFTSVEAPSEVHWYESTLDRRVKLLAKDLELNYFYIDQLRYDEETPIIDSLRVPKAICV